MITFIQNIAVGNALRLFITPPAGAEYWRVLRRTADAFTGPDDAGAQVVHDGTDNVLVDITGLVNDVEYFYRGYWWDGAAWVDAGVMSGTPAATQQDGSVDVLVLLRDRLEAGLAADVAAGRLRHDKGIISCLTAPPRHEDVDLPVVTVQLTHDSSAERVIGEQISPDDRIEDGYREYEGWYSNVQIEVTGWSFNPDERIALRQAIKRIVIGNLPVFEDAGIRKVEFDQKDNEDYESFNAPVYQTWGTFTCQAPSVVSGDVGEIIDVITELKWE